MTDVTLTEVFEKKLNVEPLDSGITKVDTPQLDYFYKKVDGEYKRFDNEGKMLI